MIRVHFFGCFADEFGSSRELDVSNLKVADLIRLLNIKDVYMVAVNGELADTERCLTDGDEVAFMPKVGGG
ncbi:molybdopterin synthase sulfur carrier subunit [Coprothermobacteraceae bacterium]|nr:molybdopterin synthase sulfur carrier subunit [Coprothermobacteraceae bacterium]